jgi:phenylacetate-CoA ligase
MSRWIAWNIVFRLHERVKGHATFRILKDMEAVDRLSPEELRQVESEKLREFIAYCYQHVPYVRARMNETGISPADIRAPEDLALLPVMTKADVRRNREQLRSAIAGRLTPFSSGGSTGEPLIFDLSKRRIASRVACRQRVARWWGLSVGVPELAIWGSPLEVTKQDWLRGVRDRLLSTRLLSAYEMNESTMSRYLDVLETGVWRQIFAYPSTLYLLCLHAQKQGRNLRRAGIRTVFVTSEMLFPYQRERITETFGCPVANGYGGRDSGFIAHECPQGGMHLMADAVITEIVDTQGRPVPPGEPGEIVVTDLYSHEAPFIRYATGDIGVLSQQNCSCGRPLPLLERLDGRANDSIATPDGRFMHGQSVVGLVMEIEGIEQFRIFQKSVERFHIQIVRNENFSPNAEEKIRKTWSDRLRAPLQITFEYPESLPVERSGKFRYIVSEVPGGRDLQLAVNTPAGSGARLREHA